MAGGASHLLATTQPAPKAHLLLLACLLVPAILPVPPSLNVIITACVIVYAGCWRSVKPEPTAEPMTKDDAMRFPVVGSAVLFSLFLALKFLPKELVNLLLNVYISTLAIVVLTAAVLPYVEDRFPASVRQKMFTLPRFHIPHVIDTRTDPISLNVPTILVGALSCAFCGWYVASKHWLANNVLGMALSLEGLEHLNLGSVHVGVILLCGLFVYDIFWVFCTPVMVSVAKNFDAPIKLLFPRGLRDAATGKLPFSMLGLGDIVIPGIFVALMLRYDVHRNFAGPSYFKSAFGGYALGLATTLVVMNAFNAAQPALLYIVPCVLGSVGAHAWWRGEFKQVFNYSQPEAAPAADAGAAGSKPADGAQTAGDGKKTQ